MVSELKQRAVKSIGWVAVEQVAVQLIALAIKIVLAHLLAPEAFGLIAMVSVYTAFLELFQELGLTSAVIQRKDVSEEQLSTVFLITLALGAALSGLTAAGAPLVAGFYGEAKLAPVTMLLGLTFFVQSFVHVHEALLRKALRFRMLALVRIGCHLAGGVVAVGMAAAGLGVYALVGQALSAELGRTVVVWLASPWRPRARPRLGSAVPLVSFGASVTGASVMEYVSRNADYLLIGRFLGKGPVGIYSMAYTIMLAPLRRISAQLSRVAFPAFSQVQHDRPRVARGFLQMAGVIALAAFPAMAGLMIVAPEAVRVVLGERWLRAAFLIQVLAPAGALQAISGPLTHVFRAQGRADLHLRYEAAATAVTVAAFAVGLRWKLEGVAVCYAISQVLLCPAKCWLAFRLIDARLLSLWRAVRGPACAAALMAAVVLGYRAFATRGLELPGYGLLVTEVPLGVAAYGAALYLVSPGTYAELLSLGRVLLARMRPASAEES